MCLGVNLTPLCPCQKLNPNSKVSSDILVYSTRVQATGSSELMALAIPSDCNPNQTLKIILKSNPNPEPVSIMIKQIKNSTFNEQINILSTHSLLSYSLYECYC